MSAPPTVNRQHSKLQCHRHDPPAVCDWTHTTQTGQVIDQQFICPTCGTRYLVSHTDQSPEWFENLLAEDVDVPIFIGRK